MEKDFSYHLDKAINGLDKPAINLSKNKSIYHALERLLIGTNAGSYLKSLFSNTERSYNDQGTEEVDLDKSDIDSITRIPLETELYINDTWTDKIDVRDRNRDSLDGPGYKMGYQKNDVHFGIVISSINQTQDGYLMSYTYEVSKQVEHDDWY